MRRSRTRTLVLAAAACLLAALLPVQPLQAAVVTGVDLDGSLQHLRYDGIAALSQGGQQRLLYDYPEPQRSQILDYLFKPPGASGAGAAFEHLKVEIGGDGNAAEGAEPSFAHTQAETSGTCHYRGYLWWLMSQAKSRNPNITFSALAWGVPGWMGNSSGVHTELYTTTLAPSGLRQGVDYLVRFLQCAKLANLDVSHIGILNEDDSFSVGGNTAQLQFIKDLKTGIGAAMNPTLSTKIVCCDDQYRWDPYRLEMDIPARGGSNDTVLRDAVDVLGAHYVGINAVPYDVQAFSLDFGKPLWSSEDSASHLFYSGVSTRNIGEWLGARETARILNNNYVLNGVTRTELLFYLNGFYDALYATGAGFISANQPWSGHYDVQPALWSVAHTTQFAEPGWYYLRGDATGCFDADCGLGTFATLSDGSNYSIVAETGGATQSYPVTFRPINGLSTGAVRVWESSAGGQFLNTQTISLSGGTFSFTFQPDRVYTLTTLTGRAKLATAAPPDQAFFPAAWSEDFNGYTVGDSDPASGARSIPVYLSAQQGSFDLAEAAACGGGSNCLIQSATIRAHDWAQGRGLADVGDPYTLAGDNSWTDYEFTARAAFDSTAPATAAATVSGRVQTGFDEGNDFQRRGSYEFKISRSGSWSLTRVVANPTPAPFGSRVDTVLASGSRSALGTSWHTLKIRFDGATVEGLVDGVSLTGVLTDSGAAAHATGMVGIGSSWHKVKFDDLAVTQIDNTANQVDDRTVGSGVHQFQYQTGTGGLWTPCSPCTPQDLDYQDSITSSHTPTDTMLFRYTGRQVTLFGTRAQNGGRATVSVVSRSGSTCTSTVLDGPVTVDFFHEARAVGQEVIWSSPRRASGNYCLKVVPTGEGQLGQTDLGGAGLNYIHIDRVDIIP